MAQDETSEDGAEAKAPAGKMRTLLIGGGLMVLTGLGGFAAVSMGLVPGLGGGEEAAEQVLALDEAPAAEGEAPGEGPLDVADLAFVAAPPMTVTLGSGGERMHLRFQAQLEVPPEKAGAVEALMPRIADVLGGYLRALDPAAVEAPGAQVRLRSQMLRRVRLVAGSDAVRDLLVTDFVIN